MISILQLLPFLFLLQHFEKYTIYNPFKELFPFIIYLFIYTSMEANHHQSEGQKILKKYLSIFVSSILSGFCITIGASALLSIRANSPYLGSALFGIGLFTIIHFKLWLYTGRVGAVLDNKPSYFLDLLVCVLGNFLGDFALAHIIKLSRKGNVLQEQARILYEEKHNDGVGSIFILAFMCGIMIYLAVKGHAKCEYPLGKVLFCYLAVIVFILSGHEHCVANVVYYTYAGKFTAKDFGYLLMMILGNGVGSIVFDGILKLIDFLNKVDESDKTVKVTTTMTTEQKLH